MTHGAWQWAVTGTSARCCCQGADDHNSYQQPRHPGSWLLPAYPPWEWEGELGTVQSSIGIGLMILSPPADCGAPRLRKATALLCLTTVKTVLCLLLNQLCCSKAAFTRPPNQAAC